MPAYHYRAVHGSGRIARGVATAANESELEHYLGLSQLELIAAREKTSAPRRGFYRRKPVTPRALTLFCMQATDLLKSGVPLLETLDDLAAAMPAGALRDVVADITRGLRQGERLSSGFARFPHIFPPVFVAILAAGEASGDVTQAFAQLAVYVESRARMNERLKRALRYPLFLVAVALAVTAFMMILVVPHIVSFLNSIDSELPSATRALIAVSEAFGFLGPWALLAFLVAGFAATCLRRFFEPAALAMDAAFLRLPLIGPILQKLMLARFCQCFSILIGSGLNLPESLSAARDTLGNRALENRLDKALQRMIAGNPLSAAADRLLPPLALRMIRIGERSGRLPKSLADIAAHYEREGADEAERLIGMLEPGLTFLTGAILGWVVLAVLGPIYGTLSHINSAG